MPPKKKAEPKAEPEAPKILTFDELMAGVTKDGGLALTGYAACDRIDTGSISLNHCFGERGIPRGLTTHIAGPTGSGKSTLGVLMGVAARKAGLRIAVINQEYRWSPMLAYKSGMGVPGKDYLLLSFHSGEDALNTIVKLAKNEIDLVIFDTVASAPSMAEANSDKLGEGSAYGAMAKMWSEFFRIHSSTIASANMALVLMNQYRVDMKATYGLGISRPGGKALDFYPAVAIDLRHISKGDRLMVIADNQELGKLTSDEKKPKTGEALVSIGAMIEGKSWKNVTAPNFRTFSIEAQFINGGVFMNWPSELADWAKAVSVFTNREGGTLGSNGHWFLDGIKVGSTKDEVVAWLEDPSNAPQVMKIKEQVREALNAIG